MISLKLAYRNLKREKVASAAAILGVASAAALLGWHVSLTQTVFLQAENVVKKNTAPYSAWLYGPDLEHPHWKTAHTNGVRAMSDGVSGYLYIHRAPGNIPPELADTVSNAECVNVTKKMFVVPVVLDYRPDGHIFRGPQIEALTAEIPKDGKSPIESDELIAGQWPNPDSEEMQIAVAEDVFAECETQPPAVGSKLSILAVNSAIEVTVSGVYRHTSMFSEFPTLYASKKVFSAITEASHIENVGCNLLLIQPKAGHAPEELEEVLNTLPEQADICNFTTRKAIIHKYRTDLAQNIAYAAPMALSLAFITAICMMTAVMTTGIAEQRRRIAMLRCIGMTRGGVCRLMLAESGLVAFAGWAAGVLLAFILVQIFLSCGADDNMPKFVVPEWKTPAWTLLAAAGVWLFASGAPVIRASRIAPLETVETETDEEPRRISTKKTAAGFVLMLPLLILALIPSESAATLKLAMTIIGVPSFFVGVLLCLHPIMRTVEKLFIPIVAKITGLAPDLISRRISRNPERAAGIVMTLSLGLCSFISIHIWGGTLMSSYVPNPEWPDVVMSALPSGFSDKQVEKINGSGYFDGSVIPVECSQFPFDANTLDEIKERGGFSKGVVLVFGSDADASFGGAAPTAPFRFVRGTSADTALTAIHNGDKPGGTPACIVPEMFLRLTKLNVGDTFSIAGTNVLIAAAVNLNWHIFTSRTSVRSLYGRLDPDHRLGRRPDNPKDRRTLGMIFTSEKFARAITGNDSRINFVWANMTPDMRKIHPLEATAKIDHKLRATLDVEPNSVIKVRHRDEISDGIIAHGNDILGTMARIPFWSLIVTSAGIAVLLTASAKASKREIDMMRAVGMTRGQVAALFTSEAMLAILVMLVISFVGGMIIGWSFTAGTRLRLNSGLPVTLIIPWLVILKGVAFAALTCAAAAAYPIFKISR